MIFRREGPILLGSQVDEFKNLVGMVKHRLRVSSTQGSNAIEKCQKFGSEVMDFIQQNKATVATKLRLGQKHVMLYDATLQMLEDNEEFIRQSPNRTTSPWNGRPCVTIYEEALRYLPGEMRVVPTEEGLNIYGRPPIPFLNLIGTMHGVDPDEHLNQVHIVHASPIRRQFITFLGLSCERPMGGDIDSLLKNQGFNRVSSLVDRQGQKITLETVDLNFPYWEHSRMVYHHLGGFEGAGTMRKYEMYGYNPDEHFTSLGKEPVLSMPPLRPLAQPGLSAVPVLNRQPRYPTR